MTITMPTWVFLCVMTGVWAFLVWIVVWLVRDAIEERRYKREHPDE